MDKCTCCKTKKVGKNRYFCKNCWEYLMPERNKKGIEWIDIWALLCHWHATHEPDHKDYDACHDCILTAYTKKHGY